MGYILKVFVIVHAHTVHQALHCSVVLGVQLLVSTPDPGMGLSTSPIFMEITTPIAKGIVVIVSAYHPIVKGELPLVWKIRYEKRKKI